MTDDPTYTSLDGLAHGSPTRREGMCNQCGVLVLDQAIHTAAHDELREAIRLLGIARATPVMFVPSTDGVVTPIP